MNREQVRQMLENQPCRAMPGGATMHTIDSAQDPVVCTDCKKKWDCTGDEPLLLHETPEVP
jgi:hypothetical protein